MQFVFNEQWAINTCKHKKHKCWPSQRVAYIVSRQIFVVDFTERHFVRCDEVCKFSEDDAVTQAFLELHCRWDLLTNTRLNPAINIQSHTQPHKWVDTSAQRHKRQQWNLHKTEVNCVVLVLWSNERQIVLNMQWICFKFTLAWRWQLRLQSLTQLTSTSSHIQHTLLSPVHNTLRI